MKLFLRTGVAFAVASSAYGDFDLTSQDRYVFAQAGGAQSVSSPGFNQFTATAFVDNVAHVRADQDSILANDYILASQHAQSFNGGVAHSYLSVDFTIDAPMPYAVSGSYSKVGIFNTDFSTLSIRLTGPSGDVVNINVPTNSPQGTTTFDDEGVFSTSGNYNITADLIAVDFTNGMVNLNTVFSVVVPEPSSILLLVSGALIALSRR